MKATDEVQVPGLNYGTFRYTLCVRQDTLRQTEINATCLSYAMDDPFCSDIRSFPITNENFHLDLYSHSIYHAFLYQQ